MQPHPMKNITAHVSHSKVNLTCRKESVIEQLWIQYECIKLAFQNSKKKTDSHNFKDNVGMNSTQRFG